MNLEEFQSVHGAAWQGIISNPAYFAALQYCDAESLENLSKLSPEQIRDNGPVLLAEFVGRLKLQNALIRLSVPELPAQDQLPEETYADPTDDETSIQASPHSRYTGPYAEFQAEQALAAAQPRRKYVKRKKRRKRRTKAEMLAAQKKE